MHRETVIVEEIHYYAHRNSKLLHLWSLKMMNRTVLSPKYIVFSNPSHYNSTVMYVHMLHNEVERDSVSVKTYPVTKISKADGSAWRTYPPIAGHEMSLTCSRGGGLVTRTSCRL